MSFKQIFLAILAIGILAITFWTGTMYSPNGNLISKGTFFPQIFRNMRNQSDSKNGTKAVQKYVQKFSQEIQPNPKREKIMNPTSKFENFSKEEIMKIKRSRDTSPYIAEKFKFVLFWNEKSGCTYWKLLLQLIQGINSTNIHHPRYNGLKRLADCSDEFVVKMMQDDSWTKAVFVREPRQRILSAYLDKSVKSKYIKNICGRKPDSFQDFLEMIKTCKDDHWETQNRLPEKCYKYTLIGKMSYIRNFTVDVLKRIGAWNNKTQAWIANKTKGREHATYAEDKLLDYYKTKEMQDTVITMYRKEYEIFNFSTEYFQ